MALAAQLLLTGIPKRVSLCEMCKKGESLYKCPGCSVKTCSLQCCKLHKTKLGCDGRRDETAFKLLNQFDDNAMLNDYLFLEKAARLANRTNRGFRKFRLDLRPDWVTKLTRACARRCIILRTVAPNMSRGFQNKTCFVSRRDVIMWQIEWIFPALNRKYVQSSVFEYNRVPDALYTLISTNPAAAAVLRPYKLHYQAIKEPSELEEPITTTTIKQESDDNQQPNQQQEQQRECSLKFLLRVKPNRHCFNRWRLIEKEKTLASNLRLQCIVEHPTIVVLLPDESADRYLAQNGRAPAWIASRIAADEQLMLEQHLQSIKPVVDEKEDGEVSENETSSESDDEFKGNDLISDEEDDDFFGAATKSNLPSSSSTVDTKAIKTMLPLVQYGSDSEGMSSDDDDTDMKNEYC